MFCEVAASKGFAILWISMALVGELFYRNPDTFKNPLISVTYIIGCLSVFILSGTVFILYYMNPTYNSWIYKSNPKYPTAKMVKFEIIQTLKGIGVAVICPCFAIYGSTRNMLSGYCGDPDNIGITGHLLQVAVIIAFTDFTEYAYHWIGHRYKAMWEIHKHVSYLFICITLITDT